MKAVIRHQFKKENVFKRKILVNNTLLIHINKMSVVLEPATRTPLQPNYTLPPTNSKPRTTRPIW